MDALNMQAAVSIDHRGRDIWLWWVVYTTLGYFILGAVTIAVIRFMPGGLLLGAIVGPLGMGAVGFMQWFVLRRYLPAMRGLGWTLATVLGQLVGMILAIIVAVLLGPRLYLTLASSGETIGGPITQSANAFVNGAVLGTIIGFAQWLILRRYLQAAGWWVSATAVAMALSSVVSALWLPGIGSGGLVALPLTMSVTGVIVGAFTGIILVGLLRRSAKLTRIKTSHNGL
jgi:hypothetical protein